jgi:hypothetical protein
MNISMMVDVIFQAAQLSQTSLAVGLLLVILIMIIRLIMSTSLLVVTAQIILQFRIRKTVLERGDDYHLLDILVADEGDTVRIFLMKDNHYILI